MTATPDRLVEDLVARVETFTYHVLTTHSVDDRHYSALLRTLEECARAWRLNDSIPRMAVNALIDLQPVVLGEAVHLVGGMQRVMLDLAMELGDAVRAIVAIRGRGVV